MIRLVCFSLFVCLAGQVTLQAQAPAKDPPKYFTNSIGVKFVWIQPGEFVMGSPKAEKGRSTVEEPHPVKLTKGFYLGVLPVTQEQWREVIRASSYIKPAEGFDLGLPSRFYGDEKLPVDRVSWDDCQAFLKKAREMDKLPYRLPTEAEWEYACRAGTTTPYYSGDTLFTSQANFSGKGAKGAIGKQTTRVGSFPPNAWGLYDMHGNVQQWCEDRYGAFSKGTTAVDPHGQQSGGTRVLRGGSWEDADVRCRSASRAWDSQGNRGDGTFGLRLCFTPK